MPEIKVLLGNIWVSESTVKQIIEIAKDLDKLPSEITSMMIEDVVDVWYDKHRKGELKEMMKDVTQEEKDETT